MRCVVMEAGLGLGYVSNILGRVGLTYCMFEGGS